MADSDGVSLEAPVGCPDRAALVRLIQEHAGGDPVSPGAARVKVERRKAGWTATVEVASSPPRRLAGVTCAEVVDAAALVIALAIDPAADPDPDPAADPVRVSRAAAPASSALDLRVRAGGLGEAGTLPRPAFGANASASLWRGLHGIELSYALFRPTHAAIGGAGEVAPIGLWTLGLQACRLLSPVVICLGAEAGRMTADARQLADGRQVAALWVAASASTRATRRIGGNARVYLGVEALAAVRRPRFVLDDDTPLHRPWAGAGRVLVGLELDIR